MFSIAGFHICVSRNPLNLSRFDTIAHLQGRGATVQDRVDSRTDFVLTTVAEASKTAPTSKVAAARKNGLPVIDDQEWAGLRSAAELQTLLSRKRAGVPSSASAPAAAPAPAQKAAPQPAPAKPGTAITFKPQTGPLTSCI